MKISAAILLAAAPAFATRHYPAPYIDSGAMNIGIVLSAVVVPVFFLLWLYCAVAFGWRYLAKWHPRGALCGWLSLVAACAIAPSDLGVFELAFTICFWTALTTGLACSISWAASRSSEVQGLQRRTAALPPRDYLVLLACIFSYPGIALIVWGFIAAHEGFAGGLAVAAVLAASLGAASFSARAIHRGASRTESTLL